MSELTKDNDDAALDWLFSRARKFVLLTAEEERAIDLKKWLALEQLQQLFVADAHCRRYLSAWAENTLNNPPTLDGCEIREHYYLLRREQAGLLEGGEQRPAPRGLLRGPRTTGQPQPAPGLFYCRTPDRPPAMLLRICEA